MPALPTFTPLSETDLDALFEDDTEGLRRYWLLHAVLVKGLTQREAAITAEVSERTVRNILRAYSQSGGLEALRSHPATGRRRRDRRPAASERALASALAEAPNAGGDRLWRRAQELLGDSDGTKLSRRTAYRILAQLRAELDQLPRGLLLQEAIRTALDQLRPAGSISTLDRSWWPYLICTGEYETGQSRADLQDDLALSASTYSRAKRLGIDRIAATLPQIIERIIESPAMLASQQLPRTPDFVGRREEQSYYSWRLQTDGVAHIWGLPGSGKTALAAELAAEGHRYGQTILWHTCRAGRDSTLLGIIRGLAQALAGVGDETLWRELRQQPLDDQEPTPLLETLRDRLLARRAVVVLDDVHRADPEETAALLDALADLVVRRSSRLLLVGRDSIEGVAFPPLSGMIEREAELLWSGAPLLPTEQWRLLYAATGGMPEPIRRAVALYRRNGDLARPNDWVQEIASWAYETIWSRLDDSAQRLLAAAYALEERTWGEQTRLVREVLAIGEPTLNDLRLRDLLHIAGPNATIYGAIRTHAAARLREDAELRERLAALADDLDTTPTLPPNQPAPEAADSEQSLVVGAASPAGLELLTRIHNALEGSAEILQELNGAEAHQLAEELAALQAALPKLTGPRLPFAHQLAPTVAS